MVGNFESPPPFFPELLANLWTLIDLLSIPDRDTWAYGETLRKMAVQKRFDRITFSRLKDLVNMPMLEELQEMTYVANATNFRRSFLNEHGKDDLDIDLEIATNPDTQMTFLGYRRFLESDLKYIFPLGENRSSRGYKRDVRYLAKQMLIRGHVSTLLLSNLDLPYHSQILFELNTVTIGFCKGSQIRLSKSFAPFYPSIHR